ncbi:hypothetical protein NDU88_001302 [Pleurodeles waltl]|uniref:Uncharacterized protein n=1 Tax=Pleurodeles waltl TaxID=8319 RepID=A0AAV7WLJ0_PLEWA|nr:hypothetical protein NDU88_001302 [Pleurodeles waltl]
MEQKDGSTCEKAPAHFRKNEEVFKGTAMEKGGKTTERYRPEPELDEDLEELFQEAQVVLAKQFRGKFRVLAPHVDPCMTPISGQLWGLVMKILVDNVLAPKTAAKYSKC